MEFIAKKLLWIVLDITGVVHDINDGIIVLSNVVLWEISSFSFPVVFIQDVDPDKQMRGQIHQHKLLAVDKESLTKLKL